MGCGKHCTRFVITGFSDAVPKKRGPKTDVLEALLKRVNGLEKRLKDEKKSESPEVADIDSSAQNGQEQMDDSGPEPVAKHAFLGEGETAEKQMGATMAPAIRYERLVLLGGHTVFSDSSVERTSLSLSRTLFSIHFLRDYTINRIISLMKRRLAKDLETASYHVF